MKPAGIALAFFASVAPLALWACEPEAERVAPRQRPELRPVASEQVARLSAELAQEARPARNDADLAERVDGLLATLGARDEALRRLAREELLQLGPDASVALAAALSNAALDPQARVAAAEVLGSYDTVAAAGALLERIELPRRELDAEAWMRAQCAYRLAGTSQDWVVPRLLLCLRYETDHETVAWIAATLARFGNFAGLEGLEVIASSSPRPEISALAADTLARLASERGFASRAELRAAWTSSDADHRVGDFPFTPRRELEVWRIVAGFADWQLRGVDDGRFVLAREEPRAALLLAAALVDSNRYVRVHSAQCLERMGGRARAAGPALVRALDDPELACDAAAALGAIDYVPGEAALVERLSAREPYDLRVACARALGTLGRASSAPALAALTTDLNESLDLRVAAACALIVCAKADAPRGAIDLALEHLTSGAVEPSGPESALEAWLAASSGDAARAALDAWRSISSDDPRERGTRRAEIVRALLATSR